MYRIDEGRPRSISRGAAEISSEAHNARHLFQRLRDKDRSSFDECIKRHGGFVWMLAKAYSPTPEAAEELTVGIFNDIWKFAACNESFELDERETVSYIARRYIFKQMNFGQR